MLSQQAHAINEEAFLRETLRTGHVLSIEDIELAQAAAAQELSVIEGEGASESVEDILPVLAGLAAAANRDPMVVKTLLSALLPITSFGHEALSTSMNPTNYLVPRAYENYRLFRNYSPFGTAGGALRRLHDVFGVRRHVVFDGPPAGIDVQLWRRIRVTALMWRALPHFEPVPGELCDAFEIYSNLCDVLLSFEPHAKKAPQFRFLRAPGLSLGRSHASRAAKLLVASLGALRNAVETPRSVTERLAEVISRNATYSVGHHRNAFIHGRCLDALLGDEQLDAIAFLHSMRSTRWFRRDEVTGEMPFFRDLVAFGRPMYGVFSREEIALFRQWAEQEEDVAPEVVAPSLRSPREDVFLGEASSKPPVEAWATQSPSKKFRHLAGEGALARAHLGGMSQELEQILRLGDEFVPDSDYDSALDFFEYSSATIRARIDKVHAVQGIVAAKIFERPHAKELHEVQALLATAAPPAMIDGAWLWGVMKYCPFDELTTAPLAEIFDDEVGNGRIEQNHSAIYADLLREAVSSPESLVRITCADDPRVRPEWYAIANAHLLFARLGHLHFPELLGWTLSLELVGLGGIFHRMAGTLESFGLDPAFYRLHVSADNLGSGHSGKALSAAIEYMDRCVLADGSRRANQTWRRIWTAFRAYRALEARLSGDKALQPKPALN
ncbi:hypothetical protein D5041_15285 [Verminephrobacter aporrectodeae subsp. tuberculatae]|uniref:iron-containing redox enzyme family protein n=1 Tax=Verminephrobacter aporrectodeae TaxID=1110389 RepID=UPI00223823C2|nr:iron-containing redox enzyme family protein [Verminephrobacter aporrectodeae]MCW5221064.1 hypothetical protein [Verminephrobacter aporrectodeae subsp. tuberculatae]MCW5290357.1 hypothetical protein [Verminephrobacter aporrectodeae subsp. tuberculatae]